MSNFKSIGSVIGGSCAPRFAKQLANTGTSSRPELAPLSAPKIVLNRICPFQSTPEKPVRCHSNCALFRVTKKEGYNCALLEIPDSAFSLMVLRQVSIGADLPDNVIQKCKGKDTRKK